MPVAVVDFFTLSVPPGSVESLSCSCTMAAVSSGVRCGPDFTQMSTRKHTSHGMGSCLENCSVAFVRLLELLGAANSACPTEIIAVQSSMAAFLCLHGIITSEKEPVRTEEHLLIVFTIPCYNA